MLSRWSLTAVVLCLFSALIIAVRATPQSTQPAAAAPQAEAPQAGTQPPASSQSGYVLKVTTRLVTLDLMAVDSRGNPVRDLKPEDLQIFEEHKARQKIEHFEYFEKMAGSGTPKNSAILDPSNVYSNQLPLDQLKIPPTVLLMDSLNTATGNQQQGRAHMIQLLKTLPPDTPIAVFLLTSSLRILQGFTSDEKLLRAALDQAVTGANIEQDPRDDIYSPSNVLLIQNGGVATGPGMAATVGELQDFEKKNMRAGSICARSKLSERSRKLDNT